MIWIWSRGPDSPGNSPYFIVSIIAFSLLPDIFGSDPEGQHPTGPEVVEMTGNYFWFFAMK